MPATPLGGQYTATRNADGTFDVHGVPVVCELKKGERGDLEIDRDWLTRAFKKFRTRAAEKYLPPVHVRHHAKNLIAPKVGFFKIARLGQMQYDGEQRAVLFADLVGIKAETAESIQRGELPYVSIEFMPKGEPEIQSLALLDSEPPQCKFALLTIGQVIDAAELATMPVGTTFPVASAPLVSFASDRDGHAAVLFKFPPSSNEGGGGGDEKPQKKKKPEGEDGGEGESEESDEFGGGEGESKVPGAEEAGEGAKSSDAMLAEIHRMMTGIYQLLAGSSQMESAKPQPPVNPATMSAAKPGETDMPADTKPATMTATDPEVAGKLAALATEVATLKAAEDTRKKETETAALVAAAVKELAEFNLTDETRADMASFAALGKEPLEKFVASFKRHARKDPPSSLTALLSAGGTTKDEETITKFSNRGAATVQQARELTGTYNRLKASGVRSLPPLERFIENGIALAAEIPDSDSDSDTDEE